MKIMVSACLLGENCKYNGSNNYSEKTAEFCKGHEVIPVCPEVAGGLPVPRIPAEIVNGVVMNREGGNVDREFRLGAEISLKKALEEKVDVIILQSRSPSCGCREVYDGTFSKKRRKGQGIFAGLVMEKGFHVIDVEEL